MKPDNMEYLGDGVYAVWDGFGVELRANHHENPTDRVYVELCTLSSLVQFIERCRTGKIQVEDE